MNLEKAIELLKTVRGNEYVATSDYENALNTVLKALDERYNKGYNKGYQDGFHSARYDKYMNEIYGEGESAVKYLAIEREGYLRGYADGFKQAKFDCEMDKLDGR